MVLQLCYCFLDKLGVMDQVQVIEEFEDKSKAGADPVEYLCDFHTI